VQSVLDGEIERFAAGADRAVAAMGVTPVTIPAESSVVGSTVRIEGRIRCDQDLFVDGEVEGAIELPDHTLLIGKRARVTATIQAHDVVIVGCSYGNIEASERVELRSSGRHEGDIRASRIAIEDGAYFKGTLEVTRLPRPLTP